MSVVQNPFPVEDKDRHELWQMLVERDIEAFVKQDWRMVESDFIEEGFTGIDAGRLDNPDSWRMGYPDLESYRDLWLEQARLTAAQADQATLIEGFHRCTTLRDIEISGNVALAHKKFLGEFPTSGERKITLQWQTLYQCRKVDNRWKITGFVGFLPNPMGGAPSPGHLRTKQLAVPASQSETAMLHSPALVVLPGKLVVISGQAAVDASGRIIGNTIEQQARLALDNCRRQLNSAGCDLADVFKTNVFMTDLAMWGRFNDIYLEFMPVPRPVYTSVQAGLLPGLLIEIEMWAVKA